MPEAPLAGAASGLVPAGEGWFVANAAEAAWVRNGAFGARCSFEANGPALRRNSELAPQTFPQLGVQLHVLEPGKPSGLYQAESNQEDFLVLSGECLLLVEGEERRLRAWDFVHCPPGTKHVFVGTDAPCVVLMAGARTEEGTIVYPVSEPARGFGASVETETASPREAYAPFGHWQPGPRPVGFPQRRSGRRRDGAGVDLAPIVTTVRRATPFCGYSGALDAATRAFAGGVGPGDDFRAAQARPRRAEGRGAAPRRLRSPRRPSVRRPASQQVFRADRRILRCRGPTPRPQGDRRRLLSRVPRFRSGPAFRGPGVR